MRYYNYNDILNKKISFNETSWKTYNREIKPKNSEIENKIKEWYKKFKQEWPTTEDWNYVYGLEDEILLPYQDLVMKNLGLVRYINKNSLEQFVQNRKIVNKILQNYEYIGFLEKDCITTLHPTTTDIYKMNRDKQKYKYIYQFNNKALAHLSMIDKVLDEICNKKINKIFIPHLENENSLEFKIVYDENNNVHIVNDKQFVEKLDRLNINKGKIIYDLDFIFNEYKKFDTIDIKKQLHFDHDRLYGLNRKQLAKILWRREKKLKSLFENNKKLSEKINTVDCKKVTEQYINILSKQSSLIIKDRSLDLKRQLCWYNKLNLKYLMSGIDELGDPNQHEKAYIERCSKNFVFSPNDYFEGATKDSCDIFFQNTVIRENISKLLKIQLPSTQQKNSYNGLVDFMPEWTSMMSKENIGEIDFEKAFKYRQLIFGDYSFTSKLGKCSYIFRSDPFITMYSRLQNISWNIDTNKMLLGCIMNSELIFPLRIVTGSSNKVNMYSPFIPTKDHILLGSFNIRALETRKGVAKKYQDKSKFLTLFIYYDRIRNTIRFINHRSNRVYPGEINDNVKVFYIELNVLMWFYEDMNIPLYFYRYNGKGPNTYFVSRFSKETIKMKYHNLGFKNVNSIVDQLVECEIKKDRDKNIYFVDKAIKQFGGKKYLFDANYLHLPQTLSYSINPKFSKINQNISEDIFPVDIFTNYVSMLKYLYPKLGVDFIYLTIIMEPLKLITTDIMSKKHKLIDAAEIFKELDINLVSKKSQIVDKLSQKKFMSLTKYPFHFSASVGHYEAFKNFDLIRKNDNVLIFSKHIAAIESVVYYQKYVYYSYNPKNITVALRNYDPVRGKGITKNFLKRNGLKHINFTNRLDGKNLGLLNKQIVNKYNFVFIDLIMSIRNMVNIRPYSFQNIFSIIILSLQKLVKGANLMVYSTDIATKYILDFYIYLSNYFTNGYIYVTEKYVAVRNFFSIIFTGFKGINKKDLDQLYKINEQYYKCDPDGGMNFQVSDNSEAKLIGNQKTNNPPKCYVNSIVDLKNVDDVYKKYKNIMHERYQRKLKLLHEINYLHLNRDKIDEILQRNIVYSIAYYKKIGLGVADWVDDKGLKNYFYEKTLRNILETLVPYSKTLRFGCKGEKVGNYDQISYHNKDHINNLFVISENAYEYVEKTDPKRYKNIELVFNNYQKELQKFLFKNHNININGKYVSRAWIKMYELYHKTKYFDNFEQDVVKAFHICEAPGNFINSSLYYVKKNTEIKNYKWNAQSLKSGFGDIYGFIKKTQSSWDYGKDSSGNIMNHQNLEYYFKKYKGVDSLVGDCGVPWSPKTDPTKNLDVSQMLYALLLPRVGGNFVIKTFSTNFDLQFLSLLYISCSKFDKLHIFRSSRNIWSPEIYIVGISKRAMSSEEEQNLLNISKKLSQGKIIYPVKHISADFGLEYEYHTQTIITAYTEIKKFFVYLARNYEFFNQIKEKILQALNQKNKLWLKKYMKHLN